jgi:hypothetical protein
MIYNKKSTLTLAAICLSLFAFGQGEPNKPAFEKVVYQNNGNIYVQKQLPLYLKFSTEENGTNYDLKSKSTPKYTDPMYLDTEGINYIRSKWAVDKNTKNTVTPLREVLYEVYADGLAPISKSSFSGAPTYYGRGIVYYGKGLKVNLSSRDAVSGVDKIHYSINGAAYSDYSNTLEFNTDLANTLYYFANDKVGNSENTKQKQFTVDVSPPNSTSAISGISYNSNIIAPSTRFQLSSSDNLSGVRTTYYSYDNQSKRVYGGSKIGVSSLRDGEHVLHYYSVDRVKNEEIHKTFNFYLDKIPPVVSVKIDGDQHRARGRMYVSSRSKVNMSATDNKAGVAKITYKLDGGGSQTYSSPFSVPNRIGTRSIVYYGTDNVQNRNNNKRVATALGVGTVYMDNRSPITGITYGRPQFFHRDTLFINNTTNIVLKAVDYESGLKKIDYSVNGNSNTYSAPFTISSEGYKTILFQATDNVNNQEQQKTSHAFVDNTPPVIYHNFSISEIGTKKKGGRTLNIYPNYTRLYLAATDKHCGTHTIKYSMNDAPFADYSSPYTLDISEVKRFRKNTYHKVVVKATDKLGNESTDTIEFFIGE